MQIRGKIFGIGAEKSSPIASGSCPLPGVVRFRKSVRVAVEKIVSLWLISYGEWSSSKVIDISADWNWNKQKEGVCELEEKLRSFGKSKNIRV